MARTFSFGTVFRMTEKQLLKTFFESFGADVDLVPWDKLKRNDVDVIQHLFDELPPDKQHAAETVLRYVHSLACEQGMNALAEAAEVKQPDASWNAVYQSQQGLYTKAMTAWLLYREVFDYAVRHVELDFLSWWRKRIDLPKRTPVFDETVKENLESELEQFFHSRQGRGEVCTVMMHERGNGVYYFFAYPNDYVEDAYAHDENRSLVPKTIRKTFEIVFAYDSIEGTSDLYAKVPKNIKEELELIFLRQILDFIPEEVRNAPYNLSRLIDPSFRLRTRPQDHLEVQLTSLTLLWELQAKIVLDSRCSEGVNQFLQEVINFEKLSLEKVIVKRARFRFKFLATDTKRSKTITFDIAKPDVCTLKNHPDQQELIHYYLKEWKIENESEAETIAADDFRYDPLPVAG